MKWLIIPLGLVLLVSSCATSAYVQTRLEEKEIHVVSKERLTTISSDKEGKTSTEIQNFVYADDETYVVRDSLWNWHFTSMTVFAKIPNSSATCQVTLSGLRIGFFSMFQNIIAAECVEKEK